MQKQTAIEILIANRPCTHTSGVRRVGHTYERCDGCGKTWPVDTMPKDRRGDYEKAVAEAARSIFLNESDLQKVVCDRLGLPAPRQHDRLSAEIDPSPKNPALRLILMSDKGKSGKWKLCLFDGNAKKFEFQIRAGVNLLRQIDSAVRELKDVLATC
jgi:hypothetical protein